jgi:peroxin-3
MCVEAITRELQARSKARNGRQLPQTSSSLASSIDVVQEHEVRSDNGSVSVTSTGFSFAEAESNTPAAAALRVGDQMSNDAPNPLSSSFITASMYDSTNSKENLSIHSSQLVKLPSIFKTPS